MDDGAIEATPDPKSKPATREVRDVGDKELAAAVLADLFNRAGIEQWGRVVDHGNPGTYYADETGTYLVYVRRVSTATRE